uniref:Uncharacterized protein n=1 Tax=Sphaerodactylus townsendi TaxID=933632 RepID=A0ACB8GDU4_9SAUR
MVLLLGMCICLKSSKHPNQKAPFLTGVGIMEINGTNNKGMTVRAVIALASEATGPWGQLHLAAKPPGCILLVITCCQVRRILMNAAGFQDRVYSLPDIHRDYQFRGNVRGDEHEEEEESDDVLDGAKAERYARMRKTKRLLSVHPFDFEMDSEYSAQSRRQSVQLSPGPYSEGLQTFAEFPGDEEDASWKESMVAEADVAAMFHRILEEQGRLTAPPKHEFSTEVQPAVNMRTRSLERTPKPTSQWNDQNRSQYSADMDTSDEDTKGTPKFLPHQLHHTRRRSRASSQENINPSGNQILELSKRMSAIERMLNRLEGKIMVHPEETPVPESKTDPSIEEKELKRKLEELASNISDKGDSSEEEERKKKEAPKPEISSSSDDLPTGAKKGHAANLLKFKVNGPQVQLKKFTPPKR